MTMYEAFLLHARADRSIRLVVGRELAPFNITMMQWLLLVTVQNGASTGVRMTELAEKLDVTMPQVTALTNDLTKLKLVKQKINAKDRRSRCLVMTPAGTGVVADADKALDGALKKLFKDISTDDIKNYLQTAAKITAVISAQQTSIE